MVRPQAARASSSCLHWPRLRFLGCHSMPRGPWCRRDELATSRRSLYSGRRRTTSRRRRRPRRWLRRNRFSRLWMTRGARKAVFEFNSPKKTGWSNLPVDFVPRNGVRLGDLTMAQRDAALAVVAAVLSKEGFQKVIDIMNADKGHSRSTAAARAKQKIRAKEKIRAKQKAAPPSATTISTSPFLALHR